MRIEFDDANTLAAAVIGAALLDYAERRGGHTVPRERVESVAQAPETPVGPDVERLGDAPAYGREGPEKSSDEPPGEPVPNAPAKPDPEPEAEDDTPRDSKGVPFNDDYCGQAKDPFYSSGTYAGQWKRRRGVSEETYNKWYAGELAKLESGESASEDEEPLNTAAAFAQPAAEPASVPTDPGQLMTWVSEQQTAGRITDADLQAAYEQVGITVADLFTDDQETVQRHVAALYEALNG